MRLYRYRNVKSALRELKDRTFYFATRDELNDPIEGYVIVYWQGDKPAWEGLFRNYICSLFNCLNICSMFPNMVNESQSINDILKEIKRKTVLLDIHQFDNSSLGNIFQEIGFDFLHEARVRDLVSLYGNNNYKCYTKELQLILRSITDIAYQICFKHFKEFQSVSGKNHIKRPDFPFEAFKNLDSEKRINISTKIENLFFDSTELEQMKRLKENIEDILSLILEMTFSQMYVERLKEIMYPSGYVVCFSKRKDNSAMWGKYANEHKGVCLIYETTKMNEREIILMDESYIVTKEIEYSNEGIIQRNFFENLGRLTYPQFTTWLTGNDSIKSIHLKDEDYFNSKKFKEQYLSDYDKKFCTKMEDWEYEAEQRGILPSYNENDPPKIRTLKYDIQSLKGIIFGIRTPVIIK